MLSLNTSFQPQKTLQQWQSTHINTHWNRYDTSQHATSPFHHSNLKPAKPFTNWHSKRTHSSAHPPPPPKKKIQPRPSINPRKKTWGATRKHPPSRGPVSSGQPSSSTNSRPPAVKKVHFSRQKWLQNLENSKKKHVSSWKVMHGQNVRKWPIKKILIPWYS